MHIAQVWIWANGTVMAVDDNDMEVEACRGHILEIADYLKLHCDSATRWWMGHFDTGEEYTINWSWWFLQREQDMML